MKQLWLSLLWWLQRLTLKLLDGGFQLKRLLRRAKIIRIFFTLLCSLCLLLIFYCVHLNRVVAEKFEGQRFSIPTRIYARPLILYSGKKWTKDQLLSELQKLHFQAVDAISAPAQYTDHGAYLEFYSRDFEFWDGLQAGQWVHLTFTNGFISTLQNHLTGQDLTELRLEPLALAGGNRGEDHEDRKLIQFAQIPTTLVQALIATEDQRFYQHWGVDLRSLARAAVATLSGRGMQGGSTITQQLVKNFYLTPERTLKRKFNELLMALILDWRYDKNDILETYLNEVYFGQDGSRAIHGIELASQFYFGQSVEHLDLAQSATLIAMLKGPSYYNPRRHPQRALQRRNLVLAEMREQNYISEEQLTLAQEQPLLTVAKTVVDSREFPAFLDRVFRELESLFDSEQIKQSGMRIFTTLDPIVQEIAERSVDQRLSQLEAQRHLAAGFLQTAVVIANPQNGEISALVGGRVAEYDGFNRALDAKRQVGSLMKPVVYLSALEHPDRYSLVSELDDTQLQLQLPGQPMWEPKNYDKRFHGNVFMWEALKNSYNIATVRLGLDVGLEKIVENAKLLGVLSPLAPFASTALGAQEMAPIEMAQAYTTMAAAGYRTPLHTIIAVVDEQGQLLGGNGQLRQSVVSAQASYVIDRALQNVVAEGTGRSLQNYLPKALNIAGKTGTTDELRDSWFVGFNQQWLGVVWVGNDQNLPTRLTGAAGALTVWGSVFQQVGLQAYTPETPRGVTEIYVHRFTGKRISERCDNGILLPFIAGSEPKKQFGCGGSRDQNGEPKNWFQRLFGGNG